MWFPFGFPLDHPKRGLKLARSKAALPKIAPAAVSAPDPPTHSRVFLPRGVPFELEKPHPRAIKNGGGGPLESESTSGPKGEPVTSCKLGRVNMEPNQRVEETSVGTIAFVSAVSCEFRGHLCWPS